MIRLTDRFPTLYTGNQSLRKTLWILAALIPIATALLAMGDARYVRATAFEKHVADERALHEQDHTILLGVDSARRCTAGQRGFCR